MSDKRTASWWAVLTLAVFLASVGGSPAAAEGSFEVYAGLYYPDDGILDEDLTYGIRLGHRFSDHLGLEATLGRYETEVSFVDVEAIFVDLSLVYCTNPGASAELLIFGGPGWAFLEADAGFMQATDDSLTAHLGTGLKIALGATTYLRPDVRGRWYEEGGDEIDFEVSLGLGFRFGGP